MDFSLKASSKALKWQATEKSMDTFDIVSKQYKKHVSDALDQWFQTGGPDPPRGGTKDPWGGCKALLILTGVIILIYTNVLKIVFSI